MRRYEDTVNIIPILFVCTIWAVDYAATHDASKFFFIGGPLLISSVAAMVGRRLEERPRRVVLFASLALATLILVIGARRILGV